MILKRHKDSHKGSNGIVLVVGGSKTFTGAPIFAGLGAMRAGADLAIITAPKRAADTAAAYSPDLITVSLEGDFLTPEHVKRIEDYFDKADVMVIGPGLGQDKNTEKAVLELIRLFNKLIIIDADALKTISKNLDVLKDKKIVLTPHRGEFEKLSGRVSSEEAVKSFAAEQKCTVLLKGPTDIISNGRETKLNKTGNSGMTVGGTGDVLAGVTAGLTAQGVEPPNAAFAAAKIVGMAGDLAYISKGYGLLASDVLERIPEVLKKS
jgi:NAD(P)H-hydrate epimerase